MEVLFEDNHLLLLNKPAGLLTQPSGTAEESLEQQAKQWLKEVYCKPGGVFLEAVHRLDRPVSGIVLFAKTQKALSRLNESMRQRDVQKVYLCWVEGIPSPEEGHLTHYLLHGSHRAHLVPPNHPGGKQAVLRYRIVNYKGADALLEIHLETGRYHQIRAQLAAIGHPISGDVTYGAQQPDKGGTILLHHFRFSFPHPISKCLVCVESPLPATFH